MSKNIKDLHPRLQEKLMELKQICIAQGLNIEFSECLRTAAEQDALYAKGRTTPGRIVTKAKGSSYNSQHQWGIAADFYRNDGTGSYNEEGAFFQRVGALAKSIGLGWGGDFKSIKDMPHLYLPDWGSTPSSLKATFSSPEAFFASWKEKPSASPTIPATPKTVPALAPVYTKQQFVTEVEQCLNLPPDGVPDTLLLSKTITISIRQNPTHIIVMPIQKYLNAMGYSVGKPDGVAGPKFTAGLKNFQKAHDCIADGIITAHAKTWRKLLGL